MCSFHLIARRPHPHALSVGRYLDPRMPRQIFQGELRPSITSLLPSSLLGVKSRMKLRVGIRQDVLELASFIR